MKVIFLDLDKTLIGDDYSPEPAKDIVSFLKEKGFKIIFNSSKTRVEQEYYRRALNVADPFIVENGSAIYIPKGYFNFDFPYSREERDYYVIELGTKYEIIRKVLDEIGTQFGLKYYGNSTTEEIIEFTGLPKELAELAMKREYSETIFKWERNGFQKYIEQRNLKITKGSRFYTVTGNTDKGKAAKMLIDLYSKIEKVESYAVGDGENDIPMLEVVDHPFAINLPCKRAKNIKTIKELMGVI
ncbi:mannosyl-3-phosphoglycerate phosphatase [Thermococcus aggregans]|uniref:Mannosyl-3-phosphoglycerate phosphatase n=1 Tax=Thermococcus aggregans TaxID=110163 RepID=A0A9E7SP02_THEAG|nr:mannosyl-3-phosphoglycerate phosphatase [Thermococcus aggregans]USS40929.1 mannosyl-3-phosphoglycerate phosphatase [Thermococcus aggregans]